MGVVLVGRVTAVRMMVGTLVPLAPFISATRKSSIVAKRCSRSLASDRMIAAAMPGGVSGARSSRSGGSSSMCLANSSPTPSALKGGRPASISKIITPSE